MLILRTKNMEKWFPIFVDKNLNLLGFFRETNQKNIIFENKNQKYVFYFIFGIGKHFIFFSSKIGKFFYFFYWKHFLIFRKNWKFLRFFFCLRKNRKNAYHFVSKKKSYDLCSCFFWKKIVKISLILLPEKIGKYFIFFFEKSK